MVATAMGKNISPNENLSTEKRTFLNSAALGLSLKIRKKMQINRASRLTGAGSEKTKGKLRQTRPISKCTSLRLLSPERLSPKCRPYLRKNKSVAKMDGTASKAGRAAL
jgi:hypothetical protein